MVTPAQETLFVMVVLPHRHSTTLPLVPEMLVEGLIGYRLDDGLHVPSLRPPSARFLQASGAGGESKAFFQTGAHAPGVCHH
jgi:hypothetical protein